jgi:hypothetical protein
MLLVVPGFALNSIGLGEYQKHDYGGHDQYQYQKQAHTAFAKQFLYGWVIECCHDACFFNAA